MIIALALLAGFSAYASTIDGYSLPITGTKTEENFTMNAVQTRTEYRNERVAKTCFRQVFEGYRTECREEPQVICYSDSRGGQFCSTRYERLCNSVPAYRQEAYTCYQTVSVPYEVFSNNVKTNVNVKVSKASGGLQAPHNTCGIDFTLTGGDFKSVAQCPEFIILAKKYNDESRVGDTVIQNRSLVLTLLDAKKLSAPTKGGIVDMKLEGQTVVFRTGDLTKNPNFSLKLFVQRRKLFKADDTLISRNLNPSEYTFEKISEDYGIVKISLSKLLGGIDDKRKHIIKIDLNVEVDTTGSINSTLPSFSASESIIVNN